jgi:hypothetical protein
MHVLLQSALVASAGSKLLPGPGLSGCLEGGCLVGTLEEASAELQGSLLSQQQYSRKLLVQLYVCPLLQARDYDEQ